jgi:hypothetical protein
MAARTAAFEFSEKINGHECEGGREVRWTKIVWQGNLFCNRKTKKRVALFEAEEMTNGVCIVCFKLRSKTKANGHIWVGWEGRQRNDFRKQKLKGFSFVRTSSEE